MKNKDDCKTKEEKKKIVKNDIITDGFENGYVEDNKCYNLKLFNEKNLENKKFDFKGPDLWKTSKDLRKK